MLNLYLAGFGEISSFIPYEESRLQQVWFLLTVRTFKSLRTAHYLLETGYYSQAMMLIRSAAEDWLYCEDSRKREETIQFLDRKGRPPNIRAMSNRLEPHLKEAWQGNDGRRGSYDLLCRFTHPNYVGMATLFAQDSGLVSVGPFFDESLFVVTSNYLLLRLIRTTEFFARLVNPQSEWLREGKETIDTVDELRTRNATRAEALLSKDS